MACISENWRNFSCCYVFVHWSHKIWDCPDFVFHRVSYGELLRITGLDSAHWKLSIPTAIIQMSLENHTKLLVSFMVLTHWHHFFIHFLSLHFFSWIYRLYWSWRWSFKIFVQVEHRPTKNSFESICKNAFPRINFGVLGTNNWLWRCRTAVAGLRPAEELVYFI